MSKKDWRVTGKAPDDFPGMLAYGRGLDVLGGGLIRMPTRITTTTTTTAPRLIAPIAAPTAPVLSTMPRISTALMPAVAPKPPTAPSQVAAPTQPGVVVTAPGQPMPTTSAAKAGLNLLTSMFNKGSGSASSGGTGAPVTVDAPPLDLNKLLKGGALFKQRPTQAKADAGTTPPAGGTTPAAPAGPVTSDAPPMPPGFDPGSAGGGGGGGGGSSDSGGGGFDDGGGGNGDANAEDSGGSGGGGASGDGGDGDGGFDDDPSVARFRASNGQWDPFDADSNNADPSNNDEADTPMEDGSDAGTSGADSGDSVEGDLGDDIKSLFVHESGEPVAPLHAPDGPTRGPVYSASQQARMAAAKQKLADAKRRLADFRATQHAKATLEATTMPTDSSPDSDVDTFAGLAEAADLILESYDHQITDDAPDPARVHGSAHRGAAYMQEGNYPPGGASSGQEGGEVYGPLEKLQVFGADSYARVPQWAKVSGFVVLWTGAVALLANFGVRALAKR